MTDDVATTLAAAASVLPGGGESRPGQRDMAEAVGRSIAGDRHLVVQAGTGTGKSLAYLVPAALSGRRVVVATATKALQDQLAGSDLPLVARALGRDLSFAVLKGRSNYLCRQRVVEIGGRGEQLTLDGSSADPPDADDPLADAARSAARPADDAARTGAGDSAFRGFRALLMGEITGRALVGEQHGDVVVGEVRGFKLIDNSIGLLARGGDAEYRFL